MLQFGLRWEFQHLAAAGAGYLPVAGMVAEVTGPGMEVAAAMAVVVGEHLVQL